MHNLVAVPVMGSTHGTHCVDTASKFLLGGWVLAKYTNKYYHNTILLNFVMYSFRLLP